MTQVPVISIVDDDASVRNATDRLVRSLGYTSHSFASAEDFLRSTDVTDAACVVTDVQMPGMSGLELQRLLSAQGCPAPIIFITAFPEERTKARALEAGAVCFLTKPFDGLELIKWINRAIGRRLA